MQVLFLFSQGIVSPTFTLDHSSSFTNCESHLASSIHLLWVNDSAVDSQLHSTVVDKFVMFAMTCTHATLEGLIKILEKENEATWERAEEGTGYTHFKGDCISSCDTMLIVTLIDMDHFQDR